MSFVDIINTKGIFEAGSMVWPLTILLIFLIVLRQFRENVQPIVNGMVTTLAKQSTSNAVAWAVGLMMGTLASLQALGEVATDMHWPLLAAFAKILQPGLAGVVAYIMASPTQKSQNQNSPTPIP